MSTTLNEAIKHALNIAEKQEELAKVCVAKQAKDDCLKCAVEHRQLAEWLKELSERRKQPERKVGKWTEDNACEFCGFKPWYERDIHTLSYCPNCGADMRGEKDG